MSMRKMLESLKREMKAGRRIYRHSDPGKGMEYNEFSTNYIVSRRLYSVDIARTPQVVREPRDGRGLFERVDVHAEGWKANAMRSMIDYHVNKVKGR